ncbi:MAG TPA: hypothetical protein PLU47_15580 [Azonexus sp.]|nr:hypothetical protein [Azonexus sp.]
MTRSLQNRLEALETPLKPELRLLPEIVRWPNDGTDEDKAQCQAEIDRLEAEGRLVFVIKRPEDMNAVVDTFI